MGIFDRLARLIRSNINALISSSEDPEKMLNQLIIDMTEQLGTAKTQVAGAIADEKRLQRQAEAETTSAAEWEKKAMLAVRAGNDVLAKEALARKKEHEAIAQQYQEQWQKQKAGVENLKLALRALNNKIEEAKRKKGILIARQKRAEAQKAIHETMSGLKNASAFEAFNEMAGRIEQVEAEAEASAQMTEEFTGDVLAHKFRELEVTAGGDEDLLALKRKMGVAPPEPVRAAAEPAAVRVETSPELDANEQAELARALAELEAEEQAQVQVKR
ncbi:MAG TPA: PspA/IM30 family protein [Polyangiaceae bacterium]|jgi:phage shock protein A|nr:PspA/IM30 family protein [Polyangiaceae bacterium]